MKEFVKKIGKVIIYIAVIILLVFIFPIFTRFLIHTHLYSDIDEFKGYLDIFLNSQFLILLVIALLGIIIMFGNKESIIEWLNNRDFFLKYGDKEASIKRTEIVDESDEQNRFADKFDTEENVDTKTITSKVQQVLNGKLNKKNNKKEDKSQDETNLLKEENDSLRFYAAYNIINRKTKEILSIIYYKKSISLKDFKYRLKRSYIDRNSNNKSISKSDLGRYAQNKYETILKGLLYLRIIEFTDDDQTESIALTQLGEEFVNKYIEEEVGDYGNKN